MIVTIKPHSTLQKYFRGTDLKADLNHYADILEYIYSLHPDFLTYVKKQSQNDLQETFTFLDKNLREISQDEMFMRKAHENDVIYIVPAIVGGGGKRGIIALLAVAALVIAFPIIAASVGAFGGASAATIGAMPALLGTTTIGALTGTIGLNLALMGVSMLLAPKPNTSAETSRDNNAFGGLTNTTASGVPIPLNYGLVRVAGQLISGYTKTIPSSSSGEDIALTEA